MGPEALIYPGAFLGAVLCACFVYMVFLRRTRPFALPSLVAAIICGWNGSQSVNKPDYFWTYFFLTFLVGGVLFGLHALFISVMLNLKGVFGSHESAKPKNPANGSTNENPRDTP